MEDNRENSSKIDTYLLDPSNNPNNPPPPSQPPEPLPAADYSVKNETAKTDQNSKTDKTEVESQSGLPDQLSQIMDLGRIVSLDVQEKSPWIVKLMSPVFFIIMICYMTLTLLFFGIIIALAIALTNAGSPGFYFLNYYPKVGLLPMLSGLATLIFMFNGFKIRDGSRLSWLVSTFTLALIPVSFSVIMPVLSYPLIKLVAVFAGSAQKPLISPAINISTITQFFSIFLVFEILLLLLILTIGVFNKKSKQLSSNAKTALVVTIALLILPISGVVAYGYYDAYTSNFGFSKAQNSVSYRLYIPQITSYGRQFASKFITNEFLANRYNAVKVTLDMPLPTIIQTGQNSPITLTQVQVSPDFNMDLFVQKHDRTADTQINQVALSQAVGNTGYFLEYRGTVHLFLLKDEFVLLDISSKIASRDELVDLANTLE